MKGSYKMMMAALLLLICASASFGFEASDDAEENAVTFEVGGLMYMINPSDTTTVTLTGYNKEVLPVSMLSTLKIDTVKYGNETFSITIIGASAFTGSTSLSVVEFSTNVQSINEYAFKGCTSLANVIIPSSVISIANEAFSECNIESVAIPATVDSVTLDSFKGCTFFYWTQNEEKEEILVKCTQGSDLVGYKFKGTHDKLIRQTDCHIHYDLAGGSGSVDDRWVGKGEFFLLAKYNGVKAGCVFNGWTDGVAEDPIYPGMTYSTEKSVTLTAVWGDVPTYSVYFDINGGTGTTPQGITGHQGYEFNLPSCSATMAGYDFGGWNDGKKKYNVGATYTIGNSDVTMKAVWNAIPYRSVTYDVNGGSEKAPTQAKVMERTMIYVADYTGTKDGFSFGGWDDGENIYSPGDIYTVGSSAVRFVAVWNLVPTHIVTYDVDGGSVHKNSQIVQEWTTFYLEDYDGTKEGCIFKGWSNGIYIYQPGDKYSMADKDITFKAVWESKEPTSNGSLVYIVILTAVIIGALFVVLRILPRRR